MDVHDWTQFILAMPGGNKYRRWYAMRNRMRQDGTWDPDRLVRDRQRVLEEVGVEVPVPKRPRLGGGDPEPAERSTRGSGGEVDSDSDIPELESSPTAEGKNLFCFLECLPGVALLVFPCCFGLTSVLMKRPGRKTC